MSEIGVKVNVDVDDGKKSFEELGNKAQQMALNTVNAIKDIEKSIGEETITIKKNKEEVTRLKEELDNLNKKIYLRVEGEDIYKLHEQVHNTSEKIKELNKEIKSKTHNVNLKKEYLSGFNVIAGNTNKDDIKSRINAQKEEIKGLTESLKELEKQKANVAPGKLWMQFDEETKKLNKGIELAKSNFKGMQDATDGITASVDRLTSQITRNNARLAEMRINGKENSDEFNNLIETNARLKQSLDITRKEIAAMNRPGVGLRGLAEAASGVAGAFAVTQSAMGLFADKSEDVQNIMLKVQNTMALMMSLQQMTVLLDKKSAFQVGVLGGVRRLYNKSLVETTTNTTGAAAGTAALTAAETAATGATTTLTFSFKALGKAILNIPGLGWILAAITAIIAVVGILINRQKELTASQKMRMELQKKENEAYIEAKKHVEGIKAKLNLNLSVINNTKQGTAAWRDAIKSVASELGVSEKWLEKNFNKVGKLTEAYIKMQYQVTLATELSKKSAEAVIENMTAEMGIRGGGQSLDERIKKIKELKTLNKEEKEALEESAKKLSEYNANVKRITENIERIKEKEKSGKKLNPEERQFLKTSNTYLEQYKEEQKIFNNLLKIAQTNAEKTGQELQAKGAKVMTKLASEYINELGIAQSDSKWDEQLIDLEKRQLDAWAKTQQEILSVKIEEANRKKDEELKNVTGTEKQIEERKYEITKTYNVEISRWKTDLEKQTQEKILELRNNTLKLIYDAELVGFEKEKVLHELRLKEIEQNEKKRLKETSDKREKSAISSEAAAAREKENADFKRIEEKRALEIRDLELETARLIFEIKTEGFERDKFLHEQKMQQIKDEAEAKREEAKGDKKKTERINENEQAKLDYEDFTFYDKLTQKYADYASKRRELAERFNAEICEMEANTTKFTQAQIEHAKEMRDRALAQLDDNAMKSSNILVRMFADTNKESSKELEKLKAEVKAFLDYLKNGKFEAVGVNEAGQAIDKFGNTYEQFQNLIKPDKLKELENGLENVTEASYKFNNGIDDIVVSYKKLLKAFKSGNLKDQQKAFLEFANTIKSVGDIAADVGKNIINSFKGISPELDKQISEVEKVFDTISTIWNRAMQGAQIVGPVGAAVGAAVGAVEAIIKLVTDKKKKDAEWEKEKAQIILDHEREMYELTKKRLKVIREIRETELGFLNRSEESLNKQLAENEKRRTNAYNNLMGKGFDIPITYKADGKTYETTKRGNFWDVFYKGGKGHYPSEDEMRDYINKLEEKFGKNNPDVIALKELLAELDSANEEREEQKRQIAEILERQKENYAGITYQGLLDSIVNAFRDGTFAAEDFANNFKDFMKQALLNALSNQMALAASGFLDKISLVSEKLLKREELPEEYRGKTEAEIWEMIQAEYEAMGELANEKFEALKKIFGGDNLFKDKRGDNKAQGFAQATSQDSINELNGRFASIKIDTSQISENMKIMLENMQNQLAYLKRIAENTDKLNDMAREILEINSWCSRIENTGIKLAS